jgi:hypothetical protein
MPAWDLIALPLKPQKRRLTKVGLAGDNFKPEGLTRH